MPAARTIEKVRARMVGWERYILNRVHVQERWYRVSVVSVHIAGAWSWLDDQRELVRKAREYALAFTPPTLVTRYTQKRTSEGTLFIRQH
jgi:hypothetical protein